MESHNPFMFYDQIKKPKPVYINPYQKKVIDTYHVSENEFSKRAWFDNQYHWLALKYLIELKHLSIDASFQVLDGLNADEAYGIYRELSKEEIIHLNKYQIDTIIKFGLAREEVINLNEYQLEAYVKLKNRGLPLHKIQKEVWIQSKQHVMALGYLLTIKRMNFNQACYYLSELNATEALAICYGMIKADFGLENICIETLIEVKKFEGVKTKNQLLYIENKIQIEIIKDLYFWGIDARVINENKFLNSKEHHTALLYLIKECFIYYRNAIETLKDLNQFQLIGIQHGLSAQEVKNLNQYQMNALIKHKNARNGLSAEIFINQDWFNSDAHVHAFSILLLNHFSVERAMIELNGLSAEEADKIAQGERRDNIINLNPYMLKAVVEYKLYGVTGDLLRNKPWFNSELYVNALGALIKYYPKAHVNESMLLTLAKFDESKLTLLINGFSPERIKKLSYVQIKILLNSEHKYYFMDKNKIENATCLQTEKQYILFDMLYDKFKDQDTVLKVLTCATEENRLDRLIGELKNTTKSAQWKNYQDVINSLGLVPSRQVNPSYSSYFYYFFSYFSRDHAMLIPENQPASSTPSIKFGGLIE